MKVLIAASARGKSKFEEYYRRIYNHVEKLGNKNLDDFIIRAEPEKFYASIRKGNEGRKKFEEAFTDALTKIRYADVNIFECTEQSFSIGYLVQKSIETNKPTIVFYLEDEENYPPSYFLLKSNDEKLIVKSYNKDNLEKVIEESLKKATAVADKRFNFFLSPFQLSFLNEAAREQGITKSTFIRNLILEHRRKNTRS